MTTQSYIASNWVGSAQNGSADPTMSLFAPDMVTFPECLNASELNIPSELLRSIDSISAGCSGVLDDLRDRTEASYATRLRQGSIQSSPWEYQKPHTNAEQRGRPSKEDWETRLRPHVEDMYKVRKATIKDTVDQLEKTYGFRIT